MALKRVIAISLLNLVILSCQASADNKAGAAPFTFNFPPNVQNQNQYTTNNNTHTTNNYNTFSFSQFFEPVKDFFNKTKENAKSSINSFVDTLKNNKGLIAASAILGTYAYTQSRLYYINRKLNNTNNWSKWRSELTLEDIFGIPNEELSRNLLSDLQKRYLEFRNPTDISTPLAKFIKDIELEIAYCNSYKRIVNNINRLKIGRLFFYDKKLNEDLTERLNRLTYIKKIFLNWVVEHNLKK